MFSRTRNLPVHISQVFSLAYLRKLVWLLLLCTVSCLMTITAVHAAQPVADPIVEVYVSSQSSLDEVLKGDTGEAYLVYYLPERGRERPSVVVRLSKNSSTDASVAEVFDAPPGEYHVPVDYSDGYPALPDGLIPSITLSAIDGWWMRDGFMNYNLDILVNGPIVAMWSSGGSSGWVKYLTHSDPNAQIIVRDSDGDGLPDWDWRTMLPEYSNRGDIRTSYAERKCISPIKVDGGIFPLWPFVASRSSRGFEQDTGVFRPPIVVDWESARISTFSEIVTLRHQNCTYGIYSIERIAPNQLNSPNFETPFAFYDLSGEGVGYPNLILRTGRTIKNEPLLQMSNPETQNIRYSWRNAIGDLRWDYKVDVLGQYQYDDETPIADGAVLIDAPSYEAFPGWVIDRDWPVVSFVAMERTDRSSEGIYDWSSLAVNYEYLFGWEQAPVLTGFQDIRAGFRGEYRLHSMNRPEIYLSPVDNRLHLKWAEHGIWRLDEEQIIRVANLDNDETIDVWSRERMAATTGSETGDLTVASEVIETLYALTGYLLYADGTDLALIASDYEPILYEALPPSDHDTWKAHRAQLAPYEAQRRDPTNLRSWLDAFPGPRSEISGASAANARIMEDGFRFELTLEPGYRVTGPDLMGIRGLGPGKYVVEKLDDALMISPLVPPQLRVDIGQEGRISAATPAQITIGNTGTADASGLTLVVESMNNNGTTIELTRQPVEALAGQTTQVLVDVPSTLASGGALRARLEDSQAQIIAADEWTPLSGSARSYRAAIFGINKAPALWPVAGLFAALIAVAALSAVNRRKGQPTP